MIGVEFFISAVLFVRYLRSPIFGVRFHIPGIEYLFYKLVFLKTDAKRIH